MQLLLFFVRKMDVINLKLIKFKFNYYYFQKQGVLGFWGFGVLGFRGCILGQTKQGLLRVRVVPEAAGS
jgi:hypothetical protein